MQSSLGVVHTHSQPLRVRVGGERHHPEGLRPSLTSLPTIGGASWAPQRWDRGVTKQQPQEARHSPARPTLFPSSVWTGVVFRMHPH